MISFLKRVKVLIRKQLYWIFAGITGLLLIAFEHTAVEPLYSFSVFFYFVVLIYWAIRWLVKQRRELAYLKTEQSRTELLHLKSQVNPHFFFNTLNNLYGLIEKDAKKAREMVLKLSEMMRYSIYEGQKDRVTIESEIEYLRNYIELHKARYHKINDVQFNYHIQKDGCKIMPLMFIILLENAFKHGLENLRANAYVRVNLIAGDKEVSFAVENNFDAAELLEEAGIGLKNLKRRLELAYPNRHTLSYAGSDGVYKAKLALSLDD